MVTLKKAHVKIVSVLIALVFVGSVVALALSQTAGISTASAASSSNVGVVDFSQFSTLKIVTDSQDQMREKVKEAQADFEAKAASMSDAEKQQYYQQTMERLQKEQEDMMAPIQKQIDEAVKAVAEAQGLTVVLRKEGVVYGGKDITQDVVKKLSK